MQSTGHISEMIRRALDARPDPLHSQPNCPRLIQSPWYASCHQNLRVTEWGLRCLKILSSNYLDRIQTGFFPGSAYGMMAFNYTIADTHHQLCMCLCVYMNTCMWLVCEHFFIFFLGFYLFDPIRMRMTDFPCLWDSDQGKQKSSSSVFYKLLLFISYLSTVVFVYYKLSKRNLQRLEMFIQQAHFDYAVPEIPLTIKQQLALCWSNVTFIHCFYVICNICWADTRF